MKEKIIAILLLILILTYVVINTVMLSNGIEEITNSVKGLDVGNSNSKNEAESIYERYKDYETYISLTVDHDDITNIEDCFVEMIGYLSVEDSDNAKVTKGRLISYLEHLRRLSGFNIDAII